MNISFIMPGRDNRRYAEWSYASIQKNKGNHNVQICFADDNSNDGTWEWCNKMMENDPNFNAIRNTSGERVGHTILYDRLINEVAKYDICIIWHCDMYLAPGALDAIEKKLFSIVHTDKIEGGFEYIPNKGTIVSLTRIEPPLHPKGPEKIVKDFGIEPEEFKESAFLEWLNKNKNKLLHSGENTKGIFAPWAFFKDDFNRVHGHDRLYAPQSKEDSDIFNKFHLKGYNLIQTWEGFVYHMTCRGSRFNPTLTIPGTNSDEWKIQNVKSHRNFIRKWGYEVLHDKMMYPIINPNYFIMAAFTHKAPALAYLYEIEPYVTKIYIKNGKDLIERYIEREQPNTVYDLSAKLKYEADDEWLNHYDVRIEWEGEKYPIGCEEIIKKLNFILEKNSNTKELREKLIGNEFKIDKYKIHVKDLRDVNELYNREASLNLHSFMNSNIEEYNVTKEEYNNIAKGEGEVGEEFYQYYQRIK